MNLQIQQEAIFVADSHFNEKNREFLQFLKKIENQEIQTSQLFLMGDIIDFISSECKFFIKQNSEVITLLNNLSKNMQIVFMILLNLIQKEVSQEAQKCHLPYLK